MEDHDSLLSCSRSSPGDGDAEGDTVIWHARLEHDLAYIRVDTLNTEA